MKRQLIAIVLTAAILASAVALSATPATSEDPVPVSQLSTATPKLPKKDGAITANTKENESAMLKKVIIAAKEKLVDTDAYDTFSYDTYLNEYGNTTFNLYWSDTNGILPYTSATIDADGTVTNYYAEQPYYSEYYYDKKAPILPASTKDEALAAATAHVKKIAPEYYGDISKDRVTIYYNDYNQSYSIDFYRVRNGFGFEYENLYLSITADGTLINYGSSFTKNMAANIPTKTLPMRLILASFKKNNPLELKYMSIYNSATQKSIVRLGYVAPNDTRLIDAGTGKAFSVEYEYGNVSPIPYDNYAVAEESAAATGAMYDKDLSAIEQKAVDTHLDLMNADDVKALLIANKYLSFGDEYYLTSSNLYTNESDFTDKVTQYISVYFESMKDGEPNGYASAQVNAETKEIISFSSGDYYEVIPRTAAVEKIRESFASHDSAAKKINAMLKDIYGAKFAQYREMKRDYWTYEEDDYVYLDYTRHVNGIQFDHNWLNITLNKNTGLITNLYISHSDDATFPKADKVIGASKAMDLLADKFPLTPFYKPYVTKDDGSGKLFATYNTETEKTAALVYSYSNPSGNMFDVVVDATSGKLMNRWGDGDAVYYPTKYFIPNAADFLKDHPAAKQMLALYNIGILNLTKSFNPDEAITREEFLVMLQTMYYDYRYSQNFLDGSNADSPISLEESVTALIDTLGYGDIAKINSIFKPIKNIDPDFTGYYAIANSFDLLDNLPANTKDGNITKAGAAALLYNYIIFNEPKG